MASHHVTFADGNRVSSHPGDRVLVVDDDATVRQLLVLNLQLAGFDTLEAHDGAAALDILAGGGIDAVLLDQNMPGYSGTEVLQRLRANEATRTLPVILVTAQSAVNDRVAGLEAGATDYLVKPFDPEELIARVRAHLRGQASWLALVADHLRHRTTVTNALCQIPPHTDSTAIAERICTELLVLEGVGGAALLAFGADQRATTLARQASWAHALPLGMPLQEAVGRNLRDAAIRGPWVAAADPRYAPLHGPDGRGGPTPVACAPLRSQGRVIGLLVLAATPVEGSPTDPVAATLSAAIDAAGIASALLAAPLTEQAALHAARAELAGVVTGRAFSPVFQPIVDLGDGQVVGFELLTRFADGTPPEPRFAEAQRLGMSIDLEAATLEVGLRAAGQLPAGTYLSVNVSAAFVGDDKLARLTRATDRSLVLEITEHEPVDDYPRLRAAVDRLGVEVSVDDAGAGYASLQHILALRPAYVKLDRSWVARIDADADRQALIAGLTSFADRTGCQLIAEGIEEAGELNALKELGVCLGQGFLLGRPAPVPV